MRSARCITSDRCMRSARVGCERGAHELGEIRFRVAAVRGGTREIGLLKHGVDRVALRVEEEDIVEAEGLKHRADARMVLGVRAVVRRVEVRTVELVLRSDGVGIRRDVELL